ncbi:hypothetical protein [Acinetobacter beijerinckii]|uniref:putative pilus system protein FilF n=1 Tax=Acinetobacter beijerinckii TaxID=262668 RepID=UPI0024061CD4|nr:hypothetical protein [Acinetobacter beijerinckii]
MYKKVLLPFTFSALTLFLNGCGGESAKINEDPTKGVGGVTSNTSCKVTNDDCLQFVLDYPIAGLNFDCSSDKVNHFVTKLESNVMTGACKVGDTVSFYIQGKDARKITLGNVKLDDIYKVKELRFPLPRIRLIDIASSLTGQMPTTIDQNNETIRVALALVKIFHAIGLEQGDSIKGDIQPTEITDEKKDLLNKLSKDVGLSELSSGAYIEILKPWVDVTSISDEEALVMFSKLLNLANAGVWQAGPPILLTGSGLPATNSTDGFFGCNQEDYTKCIDPKVGSNLIHSMGSFLLITDRQGYAIGSGEQWRGPATIVNGTLSPPVTLISKVKPAKIQVNAQNNWLNPLTRGINSSETLQMILSNNSIENLKITSGKLLNGHTIPGTDGIYRKLLNLKETDPVDKSTLGKWKQSIDSLSYNGSVEIYKANPPSNLLKNVFKTKENVKSNDQYIFPLYATLTFSFSDQSITDKIKLGIVVDEHGDIRTDIKPNATNSDMSGTCATVKSINSDGTITDSNDQIQYRIGTTGTTNFEETDKSISVRMILSNPKFGLLNGAVFGLNIDKIGGAKINLQNLLMNTVSPNITLTDFEDANNTVYWLNTYSYYQAVYVNIYDKLSSDIDRNKYVKPTDEERVLAKRWSGPVTISLASQELSNQNNTECKPVKVKP